MINYNNLKWVPFHYYPWEIFDKRTYYNSWNSSSLFRIKVIAFCCLVCVLSICLIWPLISSMDFWVLSDLLMFIDPDDFDLIVPFDRCESFGSLSESLLPIFEVCFLKSPWPRLALPLAEDDLFWACSNLMSSSYSSSI